MKTTFLVRDDLCQVVLHPETKTERAVLDLVSADQSVEIHRAQFAETQGGFVRQFGLGGHYGAGSDHLPDTVLVLRPVETSGVQVDLSVPDLSPPPADVDLCKRADGTWVYRNHAGLWHGCPAPDGGWTPPDDMSTYFRNLADERWQVYLRRTREWAPATGVPEVDKTYEVQQLRAELRAVRDLCRGNRGKTVEDRVDDALTRLTKAVEVCNIALGDDK